MSTACRSADCSGLEVTNQNTEDVLILTPNNDREEDESCDQEKAESLDEANVQNFYAAQAQISLLVDEDDLNEDLASVEKHDMSADECLDNGPVDDSRIKNDLGYSELGGTVFDVDSHGENGGRIEGITENNLILVDESLNTEMKYLFKNTRYFLIKSNNFENVALAQKKVIVA